MSKPEWYANLQSTHLRTALKIISKWFTNTESCCTTSAFACYVVFVLMFCFYFGRCWNGSMKWNVSFKRGIQLPGFLIFSIKHLYSEQEDMIRACCGGCENSVGSSVMYQQSSHATLVRGTALWIVYGWHLF